MLKRPWAAGAAAATAIGTAFVLSDRARRQQVVHIGEGVSRFSRAAGFGALVAADYAFTSDPVFAKHGKGSPEYITARKVVDKRSALRLLHVAREHGGTYAKLAQYLSTLNHVLSKEWTETLAEMQDNARARPWSEMSRVIEEDLGRPASAIFRSVDEAPVAAASIAQVHRAVTHSGETVAVKVQYPDLRRTAVADLAALRLFFQVLAIISPALAFEWLWPEFLASLLAETSFLQEASNTARARAMLASDPRVRVPRVFGDLSSERVLTLEWMNGPTLRSVGSAAGAAALGVDPTALRSTVLDTLNDLIFVHGFVHCDPHPANMMLLTPPHTEGGAPFQLVVIDWGMVRRLEPAFRQGYSSLWRALVLGDTPAGIAAVRALGLHDATYDALSLMLTFRSSGAGGGASLGGGMPAAERARLRAQYADVSTRDINLFMQSLPRDLLFVFRTTNLTRSVNLLFGGTSRERFNAAGRGAVRGLALSRATGAPLLPTPLPVASGEAAALVVDAPSTLGRATEAVVAGGDTQGIASRLLAALSAMFAREEPPRAPLTYLTAVAVGGSTASRTESELYAASRAGSASGAPLPLHLPATVRVWAWLDLQSLQWRLWLIDVIAGLMGRGREGAGGGDDGDADAKLLAEQDPKAERQRG